MLDVDTRTAILRLHGEGHGVRTIARALRVSRNAVKRVVSSGQAQVPVVERKTKPDQHLDTIRELHLSCRGNLVRVWRNCWPAACRCRTRP